MHRRELNSYTRYALFSAIFFLLAWVWLPYARLHTFSFINLDDTRYLLLNPIIQKGLTWESFLWAWSNIHVGYWIPLTWLSFLLDTTLFGLHPGAIHTVNLLLHLGNTLLLFGLILRLTGHLLPSLLAALLFGIHPQHVEAVAWAVERKEILAGLFGLAALHLHLTALQPQASFARARFWKPSLFYLASLACKPNWVTLPLLLLLLDFWPLHRLEQGWRTLIREKAPYVVLAFAAAILTLTTTATPSELHGDRLDWTLLPLSTRLANMVVVYLDYLFKTLLPIDLAAFYPHPQASLSPLTVALSLLVLLGLTGGALIARRAYPAWTMGWFWFMIALFPVSGLAQAGSQAMADRFTYLPHMGLFLALAGLLPSWPLASLRRPSFRLILAGVTVGIFTLLCWQQVGYWRDSGALWRHTLRVTKDNTLVHYLLGKHELDQGRYASAVEQFAAALQLAPRSPFTIHYKMARALLALDRFPEARAAIRQALVTSPQDPPILMEMGRRFMTPHTMDLALGFFEKALQRQPAPPLAQQSQAHFLLAISLTVLGHLPEAMPHFQLVLTMNNAERISRCAAMTTLLHDNPHLGTVFPAQVAILKGFCPTND
ncbi:MAG: tetratricopeptide repeat protein [Magnetococcales bacterium]|nr:tetratricopeptide repeat protein [Magnetococcales bacterium]MBF0322893.1 tetratricopeptide repeat protein [Magnetococcales bacterium]